MDKYIGKRLDGRYEIKEIIGVGGMAYVYKAYDNIDDRVVAVKILKEEYLANEEFTRRFKNESKAIAILSHPNIVRVYDVSFGEKLQYIVMEYIDGITLKEYIDQKKALPWKESVHFTVQVLRALQHAHDKGIVHRDIKPQNIMLLSDGTIKVTDFGIAQFSRNEIRTDSERAIGSVHYISPEQASGAITDEKADIYSLGVMMYEMLTGKLPFEADNAVSVAIMQMQSTPAMPREVNPSIPEGLEEITMKAMQKDPSKRYQSAAEMLYDIDEFKRNPSIHFEYKYVFVDETPTRFVETIAKVREKEKPVVQEEEEEEEVVRRRFPILPILAAITAALVLIAIFGLAFQLFGGILNGGGNKDDDLLKTPNLIGKKFVDEESFRAEYPELATINIQVSYQYDDEYEADAIIETDPKAKTTLEDGDTLKLTISRGQNLVEVPEVPGENINKRDFESRLESLGFKVKLEKMPSKQEIDTVVLTQPAYPDKIPYGSTVTVYYSDGSGAEVTTKLIPNLDYMTEEEARAALEAEGFVVGNVMQKNHPEYEAGRVFEQTPVAGTELPVGTVVDFTVASGLRDVTISLPLPEKNGLVSLEVYINSFARPELNTSVLVSPGKTSQDFLFQEQTEGYIVTFRIKTETMAAYEIYASYTVDATTGTATQDVFYPVTTTTPSTGTTLPDDITTPTDDVMGGVDPEVTTTTTTPTSAW